MAFELPLPKGVADVGPGGRIVTAMRGMNALNDDWLNLFKKQLENQYYGPNMQSNINYKNALTTGQNINNEYAPDRYSLQNENQRNVNRYYGKNIESEIKSREATANKLNMINELVQSVLSRSKNNGNSMVNMPGNMPGINQNPSPGINQSQPNINQSPPGINQSPSQGGMNRPQNALQENMTTIPTNPMTSVSNPVIQAGGNNQPQPSNISYPEAAVLGNLLGLGQPQIIDVNGSKVAVTPWGNIPVAQGLTAQQEAQQKGLGAARAKFHTENVESYKGMQNQSVALDNLISAVNSPEFSNTTGPIQSFLTKWASNNPERGELLGKMQSSSGEIALQVAPALKGAFTGRDQTLIDSIKANPNTDFRNVFIGKLKAQKLIQDTLMERARLSDNYALNGMDEISAMRRAAKETPLDKYRDQVDKLIHPIVTKVIDGVTYTSNGKGGWTY